MSIQFSPASRIGKLDDAIRDGVNAPTRHLITSGYAAAQRMRIAEAISAKFLIIDRDELPETTVKDGYVDIAGADSRWPIDTLSLDLNRQWALEYLAAGEAVAAARANDTANRGKRRDELAAEFGQDRAYTYEKVTNGLRRAIDRIIDLEEKETAQ